MAKIVNPNAENIKLLHLEEMIEAIDNSLNNIAEITKQQKLLIKIVDESEFNEEFKDFISDTMKQIEDLEGQTIKLTSRKEMLSKILELSKNSECLETILLVFDAFGIFEQ